MDPAQFWTGTGRLGIYAVDGIYTPERYYEPAPAPVVVERERWHHVEERPVVVGGPVVVQEGPRFAGAPEWGHGHFDNGWHGHKGEGERGEWHDNGGGHGDHGDHGEGHGHGHGHGHD